MHFHNPDWAWRRSILGKDRCRQKRENRSADNREGAAGQA
ncbi:hypothetical protein BVG79_p1000065 (plasmid) [Ketogulonicigenium robustum]|uniref:Uncharacterized protein n=1 Tax=Ketogulonicigenium robustum TaxID=92947 RepID=A0A1W6P3F0_9RHOB|nr:hypothetical protein BVG79_p1000065 [Ketogulonicigenium robustum]